MGEVLSRAQTYIQLEEVIKSSSHHFVKPSDDGVMVKSAREASSHTPDRHRGQPPYKKQTLSILSLNPLQSYQPIQYFTALKLPINKMFNTFKDHPWVRHPKSFQPNTSLPGSEEYYSNPDYKGHPTI